MSERVLVATRKGLFTLSRRKKTWVIDAPRFAGSPVSAALASRDGAGYAALNLGHFGAKLHRMDSGAGGWAELPAPAFPPEADGKPALKQIWTLEEDANVPGRLWAGCLPAGLFRSDDRGASWTLVDSLWNVEPRKRWFGGGYDDAGIHSISTVPGRRGLVTVAISCGGVWQSEDDGASWSNTGEGLIAGYMPPEQQKDPAIQDPHRMVRCAADPSRVWVQHHSGAFRSTDGGLSFTVLTPPVSAFGFAVAAHPKEPETAWFVPAIADEKRMPVDGALCVTRTRDGGKSWEVFRKGLPQENAYDLVYRHGLDVDGTGKNLAMGSTTGGLWTSGDGGESWTAVEARLPPVYAVRFV